KKKGEPVNVFQGFSFFSGVLPFSGSGGTRPVLRMYTTNSRGSLTTDVVATNSLFSLIEQQVEICPLLGILTSTWPVSKSHIFELPSLLALTTYFRSRLNST